jgi:hypothetical protein
MQFMTENFSDHTTPYQMLISPMRRFVRVLLLA